MDARFGRAVTQASPPRHPTTAQHKHSSRRRGLCTPPMPRSLRSLNKVSHIRSTLSLLRFALLAHVILLCPVSIRGNSFPFGSLVAHYGTLLAALRLQASYLRSLLLLFVTLHFTLHPLRMRTLTIHSY